MVPAAQTRQQQLGKLTGLAHSHAEGPAELPASERQAPAPGRPEPRAPSPRAGAPAAARADPRQGRGTVRARHRPHAAPFACVSCRAHDGPGCGRPRPYRRGN